VYQGDRVPQLTFRAVAMGAVLGMMMSVSNLYTTLKVGWSFGVAITACVLSFVLWNAFRALSGGRLSRMSILENNCMQSTASAAGYSTGSTIATAFGALLLIDPRSPHYPWHVVGAFTLLTGLMGVLLAIPMKRQMINHEQLPVSVRHRRRTTLRSLYSEGRDAVRQAYALVVALVAGTVIGVLNTGEGTLAALDRFFAWMRTNLFNIQLPEQIPAAGAGQRRRQTDGRGGPGVERPADCGRHDRRSAGVGARCWCRRHCCTSWVTPWLVGIDAPHAGDTSWVVSIPPTGGCGAIYHPPRWGVGRHGGDGVRESDLTGAAMEDRGAIVHAVQRGGPSAPAICSSNSTPSKCRRRGWSLALCRSRLRWWRCRLWRFRSTGGRGC
jgi:hypothetical protein